MFLRVRKVVEKRLLQGRGPHARPEDWSPYRGFAESAVLRTAHWINPFYPNYGDCIHTLQQGVHNPWSHLPRSYRLRLAQSGKIAP